MNLFNIDFWIYIFAAVGVAVVITVLIFYIVQGIFILEIIFSDKKKMIDEIEKLTRELHLLKYFANTEKLSFTNYRKPTEHQIWTTEMTTYIATLNMIKKHSKKPLHEISVQNLKLASRVKLTLKRNNLATIQDLIDLGERIRYLRSFGSKSLQELIKALTTDTSYHDWLKNKEFQYDVDVLNDDEVKS